jgi:hypothetical protein
MNLKTLTQASHARYVASRLAQAQKVWPATTQADLERYDAERQANSSAALFTLTLHTRVPSKWLMVDRETGQRWEWRDGAWRAAILPEEPYGD